MVIYFLTLRHATCIIIGIKVVLTRGKGRNENEKTYNT